MISNSFLYISTFHCSHQKGLDLSFNLMYCDLEYDNWSRRYKRECDYEENQATISAVYP